MDNDVLIKFAILSESVKKWYFNQLCLPYLKYGKLLLWQYLPSWAKIQKNWYFINFATMGEKYGKLLFWSYLPPWAKLRIKWYWAKFATLSKRVVNDYFDHICHTEQRYGRSDNLTSFTTLGDTQIRWIFAQIYYPGQNCWKMSFGHFYYVKQKGGKLLLDRICYREQKRSKIHLRSLLPIWAKTWQMSVLLPSLTPL